MNGQKKCHIEVGAPPKKSESVHSGEPDFNYFLLKKLLNQFSNKVINTLHAIDCLIFL